jgi:hypothetical protein
MQILENQPDRLTLRNRSMLFGVMFAVGALLWLFVVMGTAVSGTVRVATQTPPPDLIGWRLFGLAVVFVFGVFFTWLGAQTAITTLRGTTCIFDRTAETVTVLQPGGWRSQQQQHSLYGVSHAHVEHNDEFSTFALYLVLRSGERIPLGVLHEFQRAEVDATVQTIRAFLQGR